MNYCLEASKIRGEYGLSTSAAMIFVRLSRLAYASAKNGKKDSNGVYVYASRKQLGEYIQRSERTAQRAITELKAAGLIKVRRMGCMRNDRIYICAYDVVSKADKNGGSQYNIKSINNNNVSTSINHTTESVAKMAAKAADDSKNSETVARIAAPVAEKMNNSSAENGKKGKPTPKRPPRLSARERAACREKYRQHMRKAFQLENGGWLACWDEHEQAENTANMIADAVSTGRSFKINGAYVDSWQYWRVVSSATWDCVLNALERVKQLDMTKGSIHNLRSYTLAAIYNAVQWEQATAAIEPQMRWFV